MKWEGASVSLSRRSVGGCLKICRLRLRAFNSCSEESKSDSSRDRSFRCLRGRRSRKEMSSNSSTLTQNQLCSELSATQESAAFLDRENLVELVASSVDASHHQAAFDEL